MAYSMASKDAPTERLAKRHGEIPLVESRETSELGSDSRQVGPVVTNKANPFAKSWAHFVAGG
jgi:hypothetical protein